MTCDSCSTEAERFRGGHCIRCVLRADLTAVLQPHSPPDLRLKRLINILAEADRPESVYTWKRSKVANGLLTGLGARSISLTHEAFDALPQSKGVEFLRELHTHHGILPERDRHLATFERWLNTRLKNLSTIAAVETLDISLAAARNATLRDLVAELPPTLVARTLGYSGKVIHLHAADAAVPMAGYLAPTTK